MAHSLRLSVVAEGVETEAQFKALKELGCDEYQGYYASPALPIAEFERVRKAGLRPRSPSCRSSVPGSCA